MHLQLLITEGRALIEKGGPKAKDKGGGRETIHPPADCKARLLRRAVKDPLSLKPGGEHDRVVDQHGNTLTTIPHGEPTIGVCQSVVKVLNDPDGAAARGPRFRGQAVKEGEEAPLAQGALLTLVKVPKSKDWPADIRKGTRFQVTSYDHGRKLAVLKNLHDHGNVTGNGMQVKVFPLGDGTLGLMDKMSRRLIVSVG